jgi:4-hydroxy-3-methylbut-2-enyl diphosphate reductase
MRIIRAEHSGMCFGVRDAITLATRKASERPLTILGELVHNEHVLQQLKAQGVLIRHKPEQVETAQVLITAHGASRKATTRARDLGLEVFEATCPLVHFAHRAVEELVRGGYFPVIIGKRDHVEVRGITEDLTDYAVILEEEDINSIPDCPKIGIAAQTTQPLERVHTLVAAVRQRFPTSEVLFKDTVCQPTKNRQRAAVELAGKCDAVVVVGGANSNNTRELVQTCERFCRQVYHVQSAEGLRPEWFEGCEVVGITAGTSTPDVLIEAVEQRLREFHSEPAVLACADSV